MPRNDYRRADASRGRHSYASAPSLATNSPLGYFLEKLGGEDRRVWILLWLFVAVSVVILFQLFRLQVVLADEYTADAQEVRTSTHAIEPRRGTIYDRNGTVLAVSVDATTISCNPNEVDDADYAAEMIKNILGGSAKGYNETLTTPNTNYAVIYRKADKDKADELEALGLQGIYFDSDPRREYPHGEIAGQIIGAVETEVDAELNREYYVGKTGIEAYYDDILSGEPGYATYERGRDGSIIPSGKREVKAPVDGCDIVISIDLELQRKVEETLKSGVKQLNGKGASSVVLDAATGEIYAAASLPLFNPADRTEVEPDSTKLKVVTDLFEPGSIFKSVSAMAILENGTMAPDDTLFCPAVIEADGYYISDAHERGDATFTLRDIIDQSSNVGISLAVQNMGFEKFYDAIIEYNLHKDTGVDFPGEGEEGTELLGMLKSFEDWSRMDGYAATFGQGLSVTPLQMARFYGALLNDGVECTPHFLLSYPQTGETVEYPEDEVIHNKEAIPTMVDLLKTVVTNGTGTQAAIEGYEVAGKTSTAEIYDEENGGYKEDVYNLAFTGFIADSSSSLVCFVGANEVPTDGVVTPLFKDIMTTAVDRFRIVPDEGTTDEDSEAA